MTIEGDYGYCRVTKGKYKGQVVMYDDDDDDGAICYPQGSFLGDGTEIVIPWEYLKRIEIPEDNVDRVGLGIARIKRKKA